MRADILLDALSEYVEQYAIIQQISRLHNVYESRWLWQIAKDNPQLWSVIQMIAGVSNESLGLSICSLCNSVNNNPVEHCIPDCRGLMFERRRL